MAYVVALPLARNGISPHVVTAGALIVGAGVPLLTVAGGGLLFLAAGLTILSGLGDSLDGAVAAISDRSTALGYVVDSAADRVSDALYLLALWLLGAPGWLCVLGGGLSFLLEYVRARATAAGMREIGVVTLAERPTRILLTAGILAVAGVVDLVGPGPSTGRLELAGTIGGGSWAALSLVGLGQLLLVVRRALGVIDREVPRVTIVSRLLADNSRYAENFHDPGVPLRPVERLAVVACMDARMNVHKLLNLALGEAHVIRNAGGVVTDDVIRSLAVSQHRCGTRHVVLLHHTDCEMVTFTDDEFRGELESVVGQRPTWAVEAFRDVETDVRQSIDRITRSPFLPHRDSVRGFVYDVGSGRLREVL